MEQPLFQKNNKVYVSAPIHTEVAALSAVGEILKLPPAEERQPDLQYLTAIFVSTGTNKNGAVFLGSELIKARGTVDNKGFDIDHEEQSLIGQITGSAFLNRDGSAFSAETAASNMSTPDMDGLDLDIGISAIVHRARFPEIAQEISDGKWMVSMECFYRDFDIKVGDMIIPRDQAKVLGYDELVGQVVRLKSGGAELGFYLVGRVLRDIHFSGVGIVENPANERSVIMETAALNEYVAAHKENAVELNIQEVGGIDTIEINTPISQPDSMSEEDRAKELEKIVRDVVRDELSSNKEVAEYPRNYVLPGTCVNYRRYVMNVPGADSDTLPEPENDLTQYPLSHVPGGPDSYPPGTEVAREHYCNLFDLDCSARPGDATDPSCWRNVFARTVREEITSFEDILFEKKFEQIFGSTAKLIATARKLLDK